MYSDNDLELYFDKHLEHYTLHEIRSLIEYLDLKDKYLEEYSHTPKETSREKKKYNKGLDLIESDILLDVKERKALETLRKAVNRKTSTVKDIKALTLKKINAEYKKGDVKQLIKDTEQFLELYR